MRKNWDLVDNLILEAVDDFAINGFGHRAPPVYLNYKRLNLWIMYNHRDLLYTFSPETFVRRCRKMAEEGRLLRVAPGVFTQWCYHTTRRDLVGDKEGRERPANRFPGYGQPLSAS